VQKTSQRSSACGRPLGDRRGRCRIVRRNFPQHTSFRSGSAKVPGKGRPDLQWRGRQQQAAGQRVAETVKGAVETVAVPSGRSQPGVTLRFDLFRTVGHLHRR